MRVLHLVDHMGIGGAQNILRGIFEKDKNNNLFLHVLRNNKNRIELDYKNIFYNKSYSKLNLSCIFKSKKIVDMNKINVLHCHLAKSSIVGFLLKTFFFPNIKLIFHEHGRIFRNKSWYNSFLNHSQNRVDLFIAVSEATKQKLMVNAGIPEEKIKVLYNFVDLDNFNPDVLKKYDKNIEREKLGIRGEDFVIGFAGRLSKVKGCEYLIKSIPYINIPNFKVLIAGDGVERKNLEKLAENLNIKKKIIFLGYVKVILNFYGIIDVLVVPSKSESFGISVTEAQACGVPVIVSNVGALNELIKSEENGLLFEPATEKDLAEKMELIEKDKDLRERLIENGLCTVKRHSWEEYIRGLEKIYEEVQYENK